MKILMLTPYLPYPPSSGGQVRSYNLLKKLGGKHDITLFAFIREEEEKKYIPELERYCRKVRVFKRRRAWSPVNIFLAGVTPYPFLVSIYRSPDLAQAIAQELQSEDYGLIHAETFYVMPNIPKTSLPTVLVEQTIEYAVYKHYVEESALRLLRPLLWLDVQKIKHWEKHFWYRAEKVVAMSESDKESILRLAPTLSVDIVPNGVDVEWFSAKKRKKTDFTVLYVGYFKWLQNREAVEFLVKQIWPKIKKEVKNANLWIVGRGMGTQIKSLERDNVRVNEGIEDIRDAYTNADVLVAPIKGPGGTRLKILEAMASGIPVVTTPVGIEGLRVVDGRQALIRESAEALAAATIKLLKDREYAQELGELGRKLVSKYYSWERSAQLLDKIYREAGKKV